MENTSHAYSTLIPEKPPLKKACIVRTLALSLGGPQEPKVRKDEKYDLELISK